MHIKKEYVLLTGIALLSLWNVSCVSLNSPVQNIVKTIESYSDPETVRQGVPTILILLDSLVQSDPENTDLLFAAANAYNTYCQAFLIDDEQFARAQKLFEIGKRHSFNLFKNKRYVDDLSTISVIELEDSVKKLEKKDVPYLFTTASVWMGWILTHLESMKAVADLPKALALMNRVLELDDGYNNGAVHIFYGIYFAVQPRNGGQDLVKSKSHFDEATRIAGEGSLLPLVSFAEHYARATLDDQLFTKTLTAVINSDLQARPEIRLVNEIAVSRAKYLLKNKDDYF